MDRTANQNSFASGFSKYREQQASPNTIQEDQDPAEYNPQNTSHFDTSTIPPDPANPGPTHQALFQSHCTLLPHHSPLTSSYFQSTFYGTNPQQQQPAPPPPLLPPPMTTVIPPVQHSSNHKSHVAVPFKFTCR